MKITDFDFDLPKNLIAQVPAEYRDMSRLMVVERKTGNIHHDIFSRLTQYITAHPLMVFNNTRVNPARLIGTKKGTHRSMELLLIRETEPRIWESLIRGLSHLKPGDEILFGNGRLKAEFLKRENERGIIRLAGSGDLKLLLSEEARMPLPPYIHRDSNENNTLESLDRERYQTIYAKNSGSIAAPTAGLHFTQDIFDRIEAGVADTAHLTLHVGVGTFQPIRHEDITRHKMEKEYYMVPPETTQNLKKAKLEEGRKILAVGTTSTRVLESLNVDKIPNESPISGWTDKFIYPGYQFRAVQEMLTNFHLPKSTLYLLVCAFAGKEMMEKAYREAIRQKYRFFSYGDAMLIL